jgi:cytochrome c biogenesis protein
MFNGEEYGFSNNLTQYDDFAPGSLFDPAVMEPFSFSITDFDVEWMTDGRRAGQARKFVAHLDYETEPGAETQQYDLRVNHPLSIGGTDVFLIGHGYAPVITVRDGEGNVAQSGPAVFLPTNGQTFESFGVVKAPDAQPTQIGLEGTFYPTFAMGRDADGNLTMPSSAWGDALDPLVSLNVYTGDVGLDDGTGASVYVLDKTRAEQLTKANGQPFRMDLRPGETVTLPDDLGSVTFEGVQRWNKIQISRTPGKLIALSGVVLALLGLLGSLFVRPRRLWVRARRQDDGTTLVEVARLDRSSGGDPENGRAELAAIVASLTKEKP